MPTPTKDNHTADTLDYAAKLREAMNEQPDDSAQEQENIPPMEDDVARLLRQQLSLFGSSAPRTAEGKSESLWDTAEFEDDTQDELPMEDLLDEGVLLAEAALQKEQEKHDKRRREADELAQTPEESAELEETQESAELEETQESAEPQEPLVLEELEEQEESDDFQDNQELQELEDIEEIEEIEELEEIEEFETLQDFESLQEPAETVEDGEEPILPFLEMPAARAVLPAETPALDTSGWQDLDELVSDDQLRRDAVDGEVNIQAYLREIEGWENPAPSEAPAAEEPEYEPDLPKARAWNVTVDETYIATDDEINGRTLQETLSGALMSQLDEETKDSLRRMGVVEDAEAVQLDLFTTADQEDEEDAVDLFSEAVSEAHQEEQSRPAPVQDAESNTSRAGDTPWRDPLQLTLDEYRKTRRYPAEKRDTAQEEQPLPSSARAYAPATPSDTHRHDTEMYVSLGYGDDISRMGDAEKIGEVSDESVREDVRLRGESDTRNTEPVAYRGKEYTSSTQNGRIERSYQKAGIRSRICLWSTLALALCGLIYDILPEIAAVAGAPLSDFVVSRAYPAYGILALWLGIIPSLTKLCRGARSLWELKPVTYAIPATAVVMTLIETVVACIAPAAGIRLHIGGALLIVLLTVLTDCFRVAAEQVSFHVVSSGKYSYVLAEEPAPLASEEDREETYIRRWRVRKVSRLSDYFLWVTRYHQIQTKIGVLLPVAFLGAVAVGGGVVIFSKGDFAKGLSALAGTYLWALPGCFAVAATLPLLWANRIIGRHGSTVLGAQAADEYAPTEGATAEPLSDAVKLNFMASDVLGAGSVKEITVKGDRDTDEYRKMARRLFALLGSPLAGEDHKLRPRDLKGIHLEISEVDNTCLRLYMVDTPREIACEILMGTHEALLRRGVRLPKEYMEASYKKTDDSRVIYLAFDRTFRLAYAAKYMPRRSFAAAVPTLDRLGHVLSVVSFDPLVTPDVLAPARPASVPEIKLTRPDHIGEERECRSCGVVATGRAVDMTYPLLACRRIKQAERAGIYLTVMMLALSLGTMATLLWTGALSHVGTPLLWLWQFAGAGGMALTVRYRIRPKTMSVTAKKNK